MIFKLKYIDIDKYCEKRIHVYNSIYVPDIVRIYKYECE